MKKLEIFKTKKVVNKNGQLTFNIGFTPLKVPASVKTVKNILKNKANPAAFGATD